MRNKESTNTNRNSATVVGTLFLIAMATSLIGAGLIETVLTTPLDLSQVSANETQVRIGVLLELINGIAVIGIAVLMFPIFKKFDEGLALGYVAFRLIEATIVFAALITPLTLIVLGQDFLTTEASNASYLQTVGGAFVAVRGHLIGEMLGIFFSLAALLFYYLLYRSKLVPRFLTVWGLVAVALIFTWNFLELLGVRVNAGIVFGLPIILNEIVLGIWLIAKGFDSPSSVSEPAKAAIKAV